MSSYSVLSPSQSLSAHLSSALGSVSMLAHAHISRSRSLDLGVCSLALPRTSWQWLGLACCSAAKGGVSCCSSWHQAEARLESASALLVRVGERLLLPHVSLPVCCAWPAWRYTPQLAGGPPAALRPLDAGLPLCQRGCSKCLLLGRCA